MKNTICIITLLIAFGASAQQKYQQKKEEIHAVKVAFITNEIGLTSAEAEKFWPIYNTFDDKQSDIRRGFRKFQKSDENLDKLSESDAAARVAQLQQNEDEIYELRKKYYTNLKSVLSNVKILKLKRAEENFNRKLLKDYREKARGSK